MDTVETEVDLEVLEWGEYLDELRRERGLRLEDLAALIDVDVSYLRRLISGKDIPLDLSYDETITKALRLPDLQFEKLRKTHQFSLIGKRAGFLSPKRLRMLRLRFWYEYEKLVASLPVALIADLRRKLFPTKDDRTIADQTANSSGHSDAHGVREDIAHTTEGQHPSPTGTARPRPLAPSRPSLKSPYDWYLKDISSAAASFELCVNPSPAADGGTVQYFYQVLDQAGNPFRDSGWVSGTCWTTPSLNPGIYSWKVKAGVGNGAASSDWSQKTWHFSVASSEVAISDISFRQLDSDQMHMCVNVTFGGIIVPDVYAWLNKNADGSQTGEWRLLDHFGPNAGSCQDSYQQHGFRIYRREYIPGRHAIKITAIKRDVDRNPVSSATKSASVDIPYIFPDLRGA